MAQKLLGSAVAGSHELQRGQLPVGRGRHSGFPHALTNRDHLVERGGSLLAPMPPGVRQGRAQREEGPDHDVVLPALVGLGDRPTEALQPGLQHPRAEGGLAGLELGPCRGRARRRATGGRDGAGVHGQEDAPSGLHGQLPAEQLDAGGELARGRHRVPRHRVAPGQQLLVLLDQRIERHEMRSQVDRPLRLAGRQPRQGRLTKHGLRQGRHAPPLVEQPCLERGRGREVHLSEEIPAEIGDLQGLHPGAPLQCSNVDERARWEWQLERVTPKDLGISQDPAKLRQVPAKAAQRVVGVGEQQPAKPRSGHGRPRAQQVRQERPGLPPLGGIGGHAVALDSRPAQEVDRQRHGGPSVPGSAWLDLTRGFTRPPPTLRSIRPAAPVE